MTTRRPCLAAVAADPCRRPKRARGLALLLGSAAVAAGGGCATSAPVAQDEAPRFEFDQPASTTVASRLTTPVAGLDDDVGVAVSPDDREIWLTWLHFVPGRGDQLWVGLRGDADDWVFQREVSDEESGVRCARPTLTFDRVGQLWLSVEVAAASGAPWDLQIRRHLGEGRFTPPQSVGRPRANDIHHRTAGDREGLWLVWQGEERGQFDIFARNVNTTGMGELHRVSDQPRGDWQPDIAVAEDGGVIVVWDAYTGESFDVHLRRRVAGAWQPPRVVASGPAFQAHAQVAIGTEGSWLLWEEGGANWGGVFTGKREPGTDRAVNNMRDDAGPLHRHRRLLLASLTADDQLRELLDPLPQPSIELAAKRAHRAPGIQALGAYYERGELVLDRAARPWVLYRQRYQPGAGRAGAMEHHVEEGWRLYARTLGDRGWSPLLGLDVPQGDAMQRATIAAIGTDLVAAWTTGRADRRGGTETRGNVLARLRSPRVPPGATSTAAHRFAARSAPARALPLFVPEPGGDAQPNWPAPASDGSPQLLFGDMHRHTDLSLCFNSLDGSPEDAYRYAIEAARLDFLAITDHTRDIEHGDALSLLWWRITKAVTRHRLAGRFAPFFAFERSNGDTDHNVISLRDDILRPHEDPLPLFWQELTGETLTLPHSPMRDRLSGPCDLERVDV